MKLHTEINTVWQKLQRPSVVGRESWAGLQSLLWIRGQEQKEEAGKSPKKVVGQASYKAVHGRVGTSGEHTGHMGTPWPSHEILESRRSHLYVKALSLSWNPQPLLTWNSPILILPSTLMPWNGVSQWTMGVLFWLGCLASDLLSSAWFHRPSAWVTCMHSHACIFMWTLGI